MAQTRFKRGTPIRYTYPGGKLVPGRIIRHYTDKEIAVHRKTHGDYAASQLPNWVICELTDEGGTYQGACHVSQILTGKD